MELSAVATSFASLLFVMALIMGANLLLQRYGADKLATRLQKQGKRLKVQEVLVIDARHKLVLVQQDETEHLLLLSQQQGQIVRSTPLVREVA